MAALWQLCMGNVFSLLGLPEKARQVLGLSTIKRHSGSGMEFFFPKLDGRCQEREATFTKSTVAKKFSNPGEELGWPKRLSFGSRERSGVEYLIV